MAAPGFDKKALRADLRAQREARRRKEDLTRKSGVEKLAEGYIDALYHFQKWRTPSCWRKVAPARRIGEAK
eukprot:4484924-Pleurochrysis_carterae.AAC.1